jgi:hypothetical protein
MLSFLKALQSSYYNYSLVCLFFFAASDSFFLIFIPLFLYVAKELRARNQGLLS